MKVGNSPLASRAFRTIPPLLPEVMQSFSSWVRVISSWSPGMTMSRTMSSSEMQSATFFSIRAWSVPTTDSRARLTRPFCTSGGRQSLSWGERVSIISRIVGGLAGSPAISVGSSVTGLVSSSVGVFPGMRVPVVVGSGAGAFVGVSGAVVGISRTWVPGSSWAAGAASVLVDGIWLVTAVGMDPEVGLACSQARLMMSTEARMVRICGISALMFSEWSRRRL